MNLFKLFLTLSALALAFAHSVLANEAVSFSSGLQFRMDSNTDILGEDGERHPDVTPFRVRLTPRVKFQASENGDFTVRLRAEYRHAASADKAEVFAEKWLYQYNYEGTELQVGRGDLPFWSQNDLFWDGDVTPAGIFASKTVSGDSLETIFSGGYFQLPYGKDEFEDNMAAAQVRFLGSAGEIDWNVVASSYLIDSDAGSGAFAGWDRARDYSILSLSFRAETEALGKPFAAGIDFYKNTESYDASDPIAQDGEDLAYVFTASWEAKEDLKFGYLFARVEALSVNMPYSQPDWLRFSYGAPPAGTKGHGLWGTYSINETHSVTGYLFFRDSLNSLEEETRFRFEYNTSF